MATLLFFKTLPLPFFLPPARMQKPKKQNLKAKTQMQMQQQ